MAQDNEAPDPSLGEGMDLLGEGARMILEGILDDMRPMLDEAQPFFREEFLPMLQRLGEVMDDLTLYDLPERLPNGDIIIRRSPDAPAPDAMPEPGEDGEIEL